MKKLDDTDLKLKKLQETVAMRHGLKVDLYRVEGKGVLVVPYGKALHPFNVIYAMSDEEFLSL